MVVTTDLVWKWTWGKSIGDVRGNEIEVCLAQDICPALSSWVEAHNTRMHLVLMYLPGCQGNMGIDAEAMWPTLDLLGINRSSLSSTKAFDYFGALGGLFPYVKPVDLLLTSVMSELIVGQWGVAHGGMAKKYCRPGQYPQQATGKRMAWNSLFALVSKGA
ncbi:hypothetical protein LEMLEM_LOCUS13618 [Lemmus lemmus]